VKGEPMLFFLKIFKSILESLGYFPTNSKALEQSCGLEYGFQQRCGRGIEQNGRIICSF
jgi:hypothetical protein